MHLQESCNNKMIALASPHDAVSRQIRPFSRYFRPRCRRLRRAADLVARLAGRHVRPRDQLGARHPLNPVLGYAPDGGSLLFDGLVSRNADLSLRPALADKLPEIDGTTVTFTLRQGVTFHDGTPLTSEDVAYTYQSVLDDQNNSSIRGDFAAIESVAATDPATVVFKLKYPYAAILQRATLGIVPKKLLDGQSLESADFNTKPVGTGPYTFVSWTPGDKLVVKANPAYWGGVPAIKQLVVAYAGDDNVRATRMAAGEFDATVLPPKAAARFDGRQGLTVHRVPSADYRG